jgi:membrane-associated phospholipid phosphatase
MCLFPRRLKRYVGKSNPLLMEVSLLQLVLFGLLARWIHKHPLVPADITISQRLQGNRQPSLKKVVHLLSEVGKAPVLTLSSSITGLILWRRQLRLEAVMVIGTSVTSSLCKDLFQFIVNRPRPAPPLVEVMEKPHGPGFPSGHVIASVAFWGWLSILIGKRLDGKYGWQRSLLAIPTFFVAAVGPVRVYLGDHWTSDVLGGYLLGGAWLGFAYQLYRFLKARAVLSQ